MRFPVILKLISACCLVVALLSSCQPPLTHEPAASSKIQQEKIEYFLIQDHDTSSQPYKSRITYYFNNGLLHRWIERDSLDRLTTDYIAEYDTNWVQTGARYIELEAGELFNGEYNIEKVSFLDDTLKTTEWLDSAGNVYYQMVEELNEFGKPDRAAFIGDELHGYDSSYYTDKGFVKRIFFTNIRGRTFNDRTFEYTDINEKGDWTVRLKIMSDTVREIQKRKIFYYGDTPVRISKFMEGVVSVADFSQNSLSFSQNGDRLFYTQGGDWEYQQGFISRKVKGLYTPPQKLKLMDSVYNGAISPSGNKIIFCKRRGKTTEIFLTEKVDGSWTKPLNLTSQSGLQGGYFNWFHEEQIYFYLPRQNGDLATAKLKDGRLVDIQDLSSLNTTAAEFSPYVDKKKRYLIFTRYREGDPQQQGFFISYNEGTTSRPLWGKAKKIENLPYGWGAFVANDDQTFFFTDGEDIFTAPLSQLQLNL